MSGDTFPEVGTIYHSGTVETPEGSLNVRVGAVVDGECMACAATGLEAQHADHNQCPYLGAWKANPGRPRNPLRDIQERTDSSPSQTNTETGEPVVPVVPDYGPS